MKRQKKLLEEELHEEEKACRKYLDDKRRAAAETKANVEEEFDAEGQPEASAAFADTRPFLKVTPPSCHYRWKMKMKE